MSTDVNHPIAAPREAGDVGIQDKPAPVVRSTSDLLGLIGSVVGIGLVCLLVVYAHSTAEGMAADVRAFAVLLQRILFVPVTVLDLVVVLFPPIAIGIDLLVRRHSRTALQGLVGAVGAVIVTVIVVYLLQILAPEPLYTGLSIRREGVAVLTIPTYVAAITGLLTAVATPARRRPVTWSWALLWVAVVVAVVTTTTSLPGMGVALLLGRTAGFAARYTMGVASQRAYGSSLTEGIQRAGFAPVTIQRVSTTRVEETGAALPGVQTPQFFADHRLYVMRTAADRMYNVIVLDGDRQVLNAVTRVWRSLRSRAVEGRASTLSLRQTAERTALLSYAVRSAGVATPAVLAIAEADESMLIVREATTESVSFADLDPAAVTDGVLDAMWAQIQRAHRCGIVHRALTPDCFRLGPAGAVTVLGWETGDLAASELARRVDLTQMIALIATKTGPARALESATRALGAAELAGLGPLLQVPAVPKPTRDRLGDAKAVFAELRTELAEDLPAAAAAPEQITRVGVRTIVMIVLVTIAVIAVLTTFNLPQVVAAIRDSDWRWAVAAFGMGLVGFAGASLSFMAYAPVKLKFWRVYLTQIAGAFVAVAAPAGFGPAAVNTRLLTRKNVPTPIAVTTAALTQVTNIVVVVVSLVIVAVIGGSTQMASFTVAPGLLITVLVVAAAVGAVLIIPASRGWVLGRVVPLLRQTRPRLIEVLGSPLRLGLGILGNVIWVVSYVTALLWAVYAFGRDIPFLAAAVVFLVGTSTGSVIPTPGGMGAIEIAEAAALVSVGLNPGVAASIILLFRVVTFWIRIPLGWASYRWMRRLGEL